MNDDDRLSIPRENPPTRRQKIAWRITMIAVVAMAICVIVASQGRP